MALVQENGNLVPQHWRNGAWMKTGDINPLPIENYIFNGTTWVPVSAANPLPVSTTNNVNVQASSALPVNIQNTSTPATPQGRSTHVSLETNATTTEANSPFNVDFVVLIANDGNDSVIINFDANTTSAGAMTLKAGEVLTDFPRKCTTIYYKALSGTQPIRVWGVK